MESLFQYAVVLRPSEQERKEGKKSEVVIPPGPWIMAKSEQEVVMRATREIPQEQMEHADRLEVLVRGF